jgi:hypothetical protein
MPEISHFRTGLLLIALLFGEVSLSAGIASAADRADPVPSQAAWVEPMKKVHAKFSGKKGTFANFGDSITVTMAYWADLPYGHKNLSADAEKDFKLVTDRMAKECWRDWKGPKFGSDGGQTIRWARKNIDSWLKDLNPETALIMFGTNDLNGVSIEEYGKLYREVVQKCLDNGTVVILSTIPPRAGKFEQAKQFAETVKTIGKEMNVPVIDYFGEIVSRRPDDWDGSLAKFKDPSDKNPYSVPTLISRDGVHPSHPKQYAGDYSDDALKHDGYGLRTYLTLRSYAEVIRSVLTP